MRTDEEAAMWAAEHTETSSATPDQVWARYADPTTWPEWDHGVRAVTLHGPTAVGTRGTLRPRKGPAAPFVLTEVVPGVRLTNVTRLPLARMTFTHVLEPVAVGCRFTHRVTLTGLLSPLFARLIGRNAAADLPQAMRTLARLAETAPGAASPGTTWPDPTDRSGR